MKIRSLGELSDFLSGELAWRKRELTTTKFILSSARSHEQKTMIRSSMCLLYAHWEGFTKQAATAFLNYVDKKGLRFRELSPSLLALSLRSDLRKAGETNRPTLHTGITEFLLSDMQGRAEIPWENAIETRSNLSSDVLQDILCLLNLEYAPYEIKKVIIDEKLLGNRNKIAHGERMEMELSDYEEIYTNVLTLIDMLRTDIENAAVDSRFLRTVDG